LEINEKKLHMLVRNNNYQIKTSQRTSVAALKHVCCYTSLFINMFTKYLIELFFFASETKCPLVWIGSNPISILIVKSFKIWLEQSEFKIQSRANLLHKFGPFSILSNDDLDHRGSKSNPNRSLHISLIYTKIDYNISFLTLVIVQKPFFYF
jgi:hypothetical protein